jgi:pilus assembly protein CpaC
MKVYNGNLKLALSRIAAVGLLTAAIAAVGTPVAAQNTAPPAQAQSQSESRIIRIAAAPNSAPHQITLALNKAAIIELDHDARDVFVGNPAIVDAVVRTPKRIFIMALKIGQTNAIFLDNEGRHIATLEIVVGSDVADLNNQIAHQMPDARVKAEALNDTIVLGGTVTSAQQASQIQDMATRYAGSVEKVVNGLKIQQASQVLIKVRVSEMSRTIAKQLGVNLTAAIGKASNGVPFFASTDNQFSLLGKALANLSGARIGAVGGSCLINALATNCDPDKTNAQGVVRALEEIGLVHTLAEPNLTAVSGESAKFLVGGEFPVPVSKDRDGNIVVQFKQFGVGLAFTPVVLDKGHVSLQISTEVSELTNVGAFKLEGLAGSGGLSIPGLAVRRAETTVELPSGGSLVIGGLLQQQTKQNIDAFPGLKDLPVLGALFRSRDFQNSETELVVMVTAYLVDPVSEVQLAAPDDGFVVPTDPETILRGRLNTVYGKDANRSAGAPDNAIGYIVQ